MPKRYSFNSRKTPQKLLTSFILCSLLIGLFMTMFVSPVAAADIPDSALVSYEAVTPPKLDGLLLPGEWDDAKRYEFFFCPTSGHPDDDITIFLKHNTTHLFIAYDVQPDNTTDSSDLGSVYLDLDNNGTKDIQIVRARSSSDADRHYYTTSYESIDGMHYAWAFGFNVTPQETSRNHTIIEIAISINQSVAYTGQLLTGTSQLPFQGTPVGVVFAGYGTLEPSWFFGNTTPIDDADIHNSNINATFYSDLYLVPQPNGGIPSFTLPLLLIELIALIGLASWAKRK